jgi:hypothetical protein
MVMNNKRINKDSCADSPYEIVMMIYSETFVVVKADLAEKPAETGGKKKSIIGKTLKIIGAVIGFLAALLAILNYLGWLEPIREFIRSISLPK